MNMAPTESLLEVRDLGKHFSRTVGCEGVTFDLWPGEVLGVVGESGSGKSTLLRCLSAQMAPDSGSVRYRLRDEGMCDIHALSEARQRMLMRTDWGIVHQNPRDGLRFGISAGAIVHNISMRVLPWICAGIASFAERCRKRITE